jgi:hypothetical protein
MVRCDMPGAYYNSQVGVIIDRIQYLQETHFLEMPQPIDMSEEYSDYRESMEYSCCVRLLGSSETIMLRAKWLKIVSAVKTRG